MLNSQFPLKWDPNSQYGMNRGPDSPNSQYGLNRGPDSPNSQYGMNRGPDSSTLPVQLGVFLGVNLPTYLLLSTYLPSSSGVYLLPFFCGENHFIFIFLNFTLEPCFNFSENPFYFCILKFHLALIGYFGYLVEIFRIGWSLVSLMKFLPPKCRMVP